MTVICLEQGYETDWLSCTTQSQLDEVSEMFENLATGTTCQVTHPSKAGLFQSFVSTLNYLRGYILIMLISSNTISSSLIFSRVQAENYLLFPIP